MRGRVLRAVAGAVLSVSLVGCSGAASPSPTGGGPSGSIASAAESPSDAPSQAAASSVLAPSRIPGPGDIVFDSTVDVGNGRTFEIRCVGVGAPTIVILGDFWPSDFVYRLSQSTTTCSYEWADNGSGSPLPEPTLAGFMVDFGKVLAELHRKAGVGGPYVFTGWSFGGHVALAEALARPDDTAGLVILDTDFDTDFLAECRASGRTTADCHAEFDGDPTFAMGAELRTMIHPLPAVPLRLVTAMRLPDCDPARPESLRPDINGRTVAAKDCATLATKIADLQLKGWRTINPAVEQTRVDSDHDVVNGARDQVVSIVLDVVRESRAKP